MDLIKEMDNYLYYCQYQKELDEKTIRAYKTDLTQFLNFIQGENSETTKDSLNRYLYYIHKHYKQKSVKRKIASAKAFFSYMESENLIESSPFYQIKTKFKEERILPKAIPRSKIELLLRYMYSLKKYNDLPEWRHNLLLRDLAIIELLFSTGLRISELCKLKDKDFDLESAVLCIKGKGNKERYLQVTNDEVINLLRNYRSIFFKSIQKKGFFFVNRYGDRFSEQSARNMINKYVKIAEIEMHITPHMFRHSFATLLLEEDVDIRYIQIMLGHSSIVTTQIYTYVTSKKQKQILQAKHPRNKMNLEENCRKIL